MFGPDFYPTPKAVARKMLDKISDKAVHFLEPSAGKGDLAQVILQEGQRENPWGRHNRYRVAALVASSIKHLALARSAPRKVITHCPKGHPYEGANLYVNVRGSKCCRKCLNDYKREQRQALAASRN